METEIERNTVQPPTTMGNVPTATPSRVNPRTGKPLSLPQPLSLQPRDPSPIQTEYGPPDQGQLIREEHEEVGHDPEYADIRSSSVPVVCPSRPRPRLARTVVPMVPQSPSPMPLLPCRSVRTVHQSHSHPPPSLATCPSARIRPALPASRLPPWACPTCRPDHPELALPTRITPPSSKVPRPLFLHMPRHPKKSSRHRLFQSPIPKTPRPKRPNCRPVPLLARLLALPPRRPSRPRATSHLQLFGAQTVPRTLYPPNPLRVLPIHPRTHPRLLPLLLPLPLPTSQPVRHLDQELVDLLLLPLWATCPPHRQEATSLLPLLPLRVVRHLQLVHQVLLPLLHLRQRQTSPSLVFIGTSICTTRTPKDRIRMCSRSRSRSVSYHSAMLTIRGGPPPPSSLGNMPTAPADKPAAPMAPPGMPADPAGAKPAGAGAPVPGSTAPAAPTPAAGTPGAKPAFPPAPATVGNMPTGGAALPATAPGAGGAAPAAPAAKPAPAPASGASNVPVGKAPMPTPLVWSTNTPKEPAPPAATLGNTPTGGAGAPAAPAAPAAKSGGPAVVPAPASSGGGATQPLNPNDKATRFSDTTAIVPDAGGSASAPGTPGKLRKSPPGPAAANDLANTPTGPAATDPKGKAAAPPTCGAIAPASGGPTGAPSSKVVHEIPLPAPHQLEEFIMPDGTVASVKKGTKAGAPTSAPAAGAGAPGPAGPAASAHANAGTAKADKGKAPAAASPPGLAGASGTAAAHPAALNESAMSHGHCSVCCPSAPKTTAGKPVEPCADQEGPIAVSAPGAPATASSNKPTPNKLTKPGGSVPPPGSGPASGPSGPAGPAEPVMPTGMANTATAPAGPSAAGPPNKLTKGKGKADLTPEEQKMEDARNLASESLEAVAESGQC